MFPKPLFSDPALSDRSRTRSDGSGEIVMSCLSNGMEILVIPDRRSPVVTHMVWYRNGAADDGVAKSGIAHFLEHLMFKGTARHPAGEIVSIISGLGGQQNAFTSYDYTAYFQRVPKDHLGVCMGLEADRMKNLVLAEHDVALEREVVIEERRLRFDASPSARLNEAMHAAVFTTHPYGRPVIGWMQDIQQLQRADALAYYERFYTPENAILIVAGDIEPDHVRDLAASTYGAIPPLGAAPRRGRPAEPTPWTRKRITLRDEKVRQRRLTRMHIVPSYVTASRGDAEALDVLAVLLGRGATGTLFKRLVIETELAVSVGASYRGTSLDDMIFSIDMMPAANVEIERLEAEVENLLDRIASVPFTDTEIRRAKTGLLAGAIYGRDDQTGLATWYGATLTTGLTLHDAVTWPQRIQAVTRDAIDKALRHLDPSKAAIGYLLPSSTEMN